MGKKTKVPPSQPKATSGSSPSKLPLHGILLAVIILAGLFLRIKNLDYLSFWGDELNHVFGASGIIEKGEPLLPSGQSYSYAYGFTYMVSAFTRVLGSDEFSNRLLPVLFGIGSIFMTYILGGYFFKDRRIGLIAALLMAVLPWYIIRSRIVRMYTMFQFIYLVFAYIFYRGFETEGAWSSKVGWPRLKRLLESIETLKMRPILILVSGLVIWIGLSVQGFAFEAGPSVLVYTMLMFGFRWRAQGGRAAAVSKYAVVTYLALFVLAFSPVIFKYFSHLPFEALMPSFGYWVERMTTAPFDAFKTYFTDTFLHLHPWVWVWGVFIGLPLAFRSGNSKKLFIASLFVTPFFIQSFVFNKPGAIYAHYLFFAFPFFLLLTGYGMVTGIEFVIGKIRPVSASAMNAVIMAVAMAFAVVPLQTSFAFVTAKKHGDLDDRANERYANWREACAFVKMHRKDPAQDVIMTTQPWSVLYYLGETDFYIRMGFNDKLMLREGYETERKFRSNTNPPLWPIRDLYSGTEMIRDYNTLRWTLEQHPRGWLIACHKLFNPAFVDKRAIEFIRKTMKQVYVDKDRSIVVFYWNYGTPGVKPMVTGPDGGMYEFPLPDPATVNGALRLQLDAAAVDSVYLAGISVNGNTGIPFNARPDSIRQIVEGILPTVVLKQGINRVVFPKVEGNAEIYHVGLTLKRGEIDYTIR